MDVKLYTYADLPNVANKKTGCELLFDSTTTPGFTVYGTFDPYSAVFYLSEYYPANYAEYTLNAITYYGACTVSVTTRGEYEYRVTVDPLTTAWYHNIIPNSVQWCDYISDSNYVGDIDPRLPISNDLTMVRLRYGPVIKEQDFDVWLITANPNGSQSATQDYRLTPGAYRVYVFSRYGEINGVQHYRRFLRNLFKLQKTYGALTSIDNYLQSMIKAYIVPHAFFSLQSGISPGTVELHSLGGELLNQNNSLEVPNGDGYENYTAFNVPLQNSVAPSSISATFNIFDYRSGPQREGTWTIVIPFVGEVSFTPSQCFPATAFEVEADVTFNPIGGFYVVQLGFSIPPDGYAPIENALYTFPCSESTVIMAPGSPSFQALSSAGNYLSSFLGMASGNVGSITAIAGQAVKDSTSLLSSHGGAFKGTIDGSPYRSTVALDSRITLYITYHDYLSPEPGKFWELYGAPYQGTALLSAKIGSGGYFQTRRAMFVCGNLPQEIVRQAESACDSGIYIRKET